MAILGGLQGFDDGSLMAFSGGYSGLGFGELHVEIPGVDLGFFDMVDAVPQLGSSLVVLVVEGEWVVGHVLHGGAIFLLLQGFHTGDPG